MVQTKKMRSIIIGAGKYGEVFLSYLQEAGIDIVGFLDDDPIYEGQRIHQIPVLGKTSLLDTLRFKDDIEAVFCPLGDSKLRVQFLSKSKELGYKIPNFIHPNAIISPHVTIGNGVYILLGSTIMPHTVIKDYVMISMGVHLAHHCVLDEGVFLSTGCNFGASIHAHQYAYCGIGSTIMTGIHELGRNCLIGAGAVVIRDVPENAVLVGVPAKILKYHPL